MLLTITLPNKSNQPQPIMFMFEKGGSQKIKFDSAELQIHMYCKSNFFLFTQGLLKAVYPFIQRPLDN
jgi:hypothetical protein